MELSLYKTFPHLEKTIVKWKHAVIFANSVLILPWPAGDIQLYVLLSRKIVCQRNTKNKSIFFLYGLGIK